MRWRASACFANPNAHSGKTDLGETGAGADTIIFAESLDDNGPAYLALTEGQLTITDSVTIVGLGAHGYELALQGADRILQQRAASG